MVKRETANRDLEILEGQLSIDENALEEENRLQPELFYKVAKRLALEISLRDAAKTTLKETEAIVDAQIRDEAKAEDMKLTEGAIENRKRIHPKVVDASDEYARRVYTCDVWDALKEAFSMRHYALKELVKLHLASYFGDISVQGSNSQIKDMASQSIKESMSEARKNVQHRYRRDA